MNSIIEEKRQQRGLVTLVPVDTILSTNGRKRAMEKICYQLECARQDIRNKHYEAADAAIMHAIAALLAREV